MKCFVFYCSIVKRPNIFVTNFKFKFGKIRTMILFVCRPILDRYLHKPLSVIKKHNLNLNGYNELTAEEFEEFLKYSFYKQSIGGTSVNTAINVKKYSEISCLFIGAVGADENGKFVERQLIESGVITFFEKIGPLGGNTNKSDLSSINDSKPAEIDNLESENQNNKVIVLQREYNCHNLGKLKLVEHQYQEKSFKSTKNAKLLINPGIKNGKCHEKKTLIDKTATCFVMLYKNERTLATFLGASDFLSKSYLTACVSKYPDIKLIYIHLDAWAFDCIPFILEMGAKIVMNLFSEFILPKIGKNNLKLFYGRASVIIGNRFEILEFGRQIFNYEFDLKRCIEMLARPDKLVICTDGKNMIRYATACVFKEIDVTPIKMQHLNTCGAGDAFAAGVLIEIYNNQNRDNVINRGIECARKWILEMSEFGK